MAHILIQFDTDTVTGLYTGSTQHIHYATSLSISYISSGYVTIIVYWSVVLNTMFNWFRYMWEQLCHHVTCLWVLVLEYLIRMNTVHLISHTRQRLLHNATLLSLTSIKFTIVSQLMCSCRSLVLIDWIACIVNSGYSSVLCIYAIIHRGYRILLALILLIYRDDFAFFNVNSNELVNCSLLAQCELFIIHCV